MENQLSINVRKENEVLVVSSREVAENFGKEHNDVLGSTRDLIKNLTEENSLVKIQEYFIESEYINTRGRKYPEYLLTEDGFTLLAMSFTGVKALQFKMAYMKEFKRMRETLNQLTLTKEEKLQLAIVKANDKSELLQAVNQLDSYRKEQIAVREQLLEDNKENIEMAKKLTETDNNYDMGVLAKTLGIKGLGRNNFYGYLRNKKILMKNNIPYQTYMERDYFKVIAIDNEYQSSKTLVKVNGVKYIIKQLIKDEYLDEEFNVAKLLEELDNSL